MLHETVLGEKGNFKEPQRVDRVKYV